MRYFIEVSYMGGRYAGFQAQENANTIQDEIERSMRIYFRKSIALTGSSRTDAGVHALQNYFHMDEQEVGEKQLSDAVYHLNAILPADIVIRRIFRVADQAHCRFDALSRRYRYTIYRRKNPFLTDRAYFFPYKLDVSVLQTAAAIMLQNVDFQSFCKRNAQVDHYRCTLIESFWEEEGDTLSYVVQGNRFLRGMVRGLTGTMLRAGTGKWPLSSIQTIIDARDCTRVDFSVPAHGLTLERVRFAGDERAKRLDSIDFE
jgi:tRNA pseudouridine38-40 synthase